MAQDAKWHKIARYDSAIVSMPDGTSAAFYRRDRERFLDLLKRTVAIHRRLAAEWDDLAARYRAALPRDHLAGGLGGDLPPLAGRRATMTQ